MTPAEDLESLYDELGAFLDADPKLGGAFSHGVRFSSNLVVGLHGEKLNTGAASELQHRDLGLSVSEEQVGLVASVARERRIKRGRGYLARRYRRIHEAICGDPAQRQKILQCDEASIVVVLADCIAPVLVGVPIFTVANLLARIGVKRLCEGNPFALKAGKRRARLKA